MKYKDKIIVFGAGGHSKVILDIIEKQIEYTVAGLFSSFTSIGDFHYNYPIISNDSNLIFVLKDFDIHGGVIAIGDNYQRYLLVEKINKIKEDFMFVNAIHPSAQIARGVKFGTGNVVMPGVIINSDSQIGNHCILNTGSTLDHDCIMKDFSSLAPGVNIGGNVNIGRFTAISLGAKIIHNITIGDSAVIGAGSVIINDIPSYVVAYGHPCKVIRSRNIDEKYL